MGDTDGSRMDGDARVSRTHPGSLSGSGSAPVAPSAKPLRIALVNDYEVVVRGLASMLRLYRDVVEVAELDLNQPVGESVDIALCDTFASSQGDRADIRALAANPRVDRVIVYSWARDEDSVRAAIDEGADGYVYKGIPASELIAALQQIGDSGAKVWVDTHGRPAITAGDWPGREEGLTARESEVLALITQGLSNAEVAERTHLSINSVKTYIRSGYRRIGVKSRTEAVLWGVEHGFRPDRLRVRNPETPGSDAATDAPDAEPRRRAAPSEPDDEGNLA